MVFLIEQLPGIWLWLPATPFTEIKTISMLKSTILKGKTLYLMSD